MAQQMPLSLPPVNPDWFYLPGTPTSSAPLTSWSSRLWCSTRLAPSALWPHERLPQVLWGPSDTPAPHPPQSPTRGQQKPTRILGGDSIHLVVITAPRASTEDQTCILQTGWLIDGLILSFPQYLTSLRLVLKEPATTWLVGSGYFPPPILGDQVELTCAAARCYIHSIPNGSLPSHYRKQRMANMLVVIPLCY